MKVLGEGFNKVLAIDCSDLLNKYRNTIIGEYEV
jgi:hypothetical protein